MARDSRSRRVVLGETARNGIATGIDLVSKIIATTIGPKGRSCIIDAEESQPAIVNDGVTVAKHCRFDDPLLNIGALIVRSAAEKSGEVGDGTSSTVVFSNELVKNGLRLMAHGEDPVSLKAGMEEAVEIINDKLKERAIPINDLSDIHKVASISANNDEEIASLIVSAFDSVGTDGHITFELCNEDKSRVQLIDGLYFGVGYKSEHFATEQVTNKAILDDCRILILNKKNIDLMDIQEGSFLSKLGKTPLLLFCDDLTPEVLRGFINLKLTGKLRCVLVQCPGFGNRRKQLIGDIAAATGATVLDEETEVAYKDITIEGHMGTAKQVIVGPHEMTIKGPGGKTETVKARIDVLKKQILDLNATSPSGAAYEVAKLRERIGILSCGLAVVYIGGATKLEAGERKLRVEDALCAVRAALKGGVVPGGGTTLMRIRKDLLANPPALINKAGFNLVMGCMDIITRHVIKNAGQNVDMKLAAIESSPEGWGFNAKTGLLSDLLIDGVLDPADVLKSVLKNAVSVAGLVLTSESVLISVREKVPTLSEVPAIQSAVERVLTGDV